MSAPSVRRERRSGLRPMVTVAGKTFVEDDQGRPVEISLYVGPNGAVTARAVGDPGVDQALTPTRSFLDRVHESSYDQA